MMFRDDARPVKVLDETGVLSRKCDYITNCATSTATIAAPHSCLLRPQTRSLRTVGVASPSRVAIRSLLLGHPHPSQRGYGGLDRSFIHELLVSTWN